MPDNAILSTRVGRLQTNQERTLLLRVELELERVHPLLQLLDFAARGFLVFVLVGETRVQILQKNLTVWLH